METSSLSIDILCDIISGHWFEKLLYTSVHMLRRLSYTDLKSLTRLAEDYYQKTVRPLLMSGGKYEQAHEKVITVSDESVTDFAQQILLKRANMGSSQTVLLLSGDGGVIDILNSLLSSKRTPAYRQPSLGLVAMGTGNALAFSTECSKDHTFGLRRFYRGTPRRLPTFSVTFSQGSELLVNEGRETQAMQTNDKGEGVVYGAVVCSWALHASIVADSDTSEYRKHGNERFSMAAKELLYPSDGSPSHQYKGFISCYEKDDSQQIATSPETRGPLHSYVLATLVSHLEPGFNISPHSTPLDGQLRLLRLGPATANEVMGIMEKAFHNAKHVDDPAIEYKCIQSMKIEIQEEDPRWRWVFSFCNPWATCCSWRNFKYAQMLTFEQTNLCGRENHQRARRWVGQGNEERSR